MTDDLVKRLREDDGLAERIEAAARIEELEAELATCEKYKAAYAECDRIGTQAVRDLESKLQKAMEALGNVVGEYDLFRKDEYERGLSPLDHEIYDARITLAELNYDERSEKKGETDA